MPEENPCVFCEIAAGRAAAAVVFEAESVIAFLDRRPLFPGHTLVASRIHIRTFPEISDELLAPLFGTVRLLSAAVRDAMSAEGTFIAANNVVSQSVPHLHVHVVPRNRGDGLRSFFWPRTKYRDEAHIEETRSAIHDAVARIQNASA